MLNRLHKNKSNQNRIILLSITLGLVLLLNSCGNQSPEITPSPITITVTSTITPAYSYVNPDKTNLPDLPTYPRGWVYGSDGWIPPLPSGFVQPRLLSMEEWDKVNKITRSDNESSIQFKNENVGALLRYWVGYSGFTGYFASSETDIVSKKVSIPDGYWFYPALLLLYRERTDRKEQLVGVDLATSRVVFSGGRDLNPPIRPSLPH